MPLTDSQLLALHKVKVATEAAAASKRPAMPRASKAMPRGKLGWVPKQAELVVRQELADAGITAANARGMGYFAVRQTLDSVNHLNSSEAFNPGDKDYGVVKAKNGRTTTMPTKPAPPKAPVKCSGDHEGPCTERLPKPEGMIRYR
jgi:hypothetical protein